jgi:hypothetical protein
MVDIEQAALLGFREYASWTSASIKSSSAFNDHDWRFLTLPMRATAIAWEAEACPRSMPGVSTAACGAPTGPAPLPVVIYEQAVEPFRTTDRLNATERAMLMGGACARAYGWSPTTG